MLDVYIWLAIFLTLLLISVITFCILALRNTSIPVPEDVEGGGEPTNRRPGPLKKISNNIKSPSGYYSVICCATLPYSSRRRCGALCCVNCALSAIVAYIFLLLIFAIIMGTGMRWSFIFTGKKKADCECENGDCDFSLEENSHKCDYGYKFPEGITKHDVYFKNCKDNDEEEEECAVIHGWLLQNASESRRVRPLNIFYSHGSGQNIAVGYRLKRYEYLLSQGNVNLLTYDYPGYGNSSGDPTPDQIIEAGTRALYWFARVADTNFSPLDGGLYNDPLRVVIKTRPSATEDIILLGRSFGGAMSVRLGSNVKWDVRAMALQSTFQTLSQTAGDSLPFVGWIVRILLKTPLQRFDSSKLMDDTQRLSCMYQSHSQADEWVKMKDAEALNEQRQNSKSEKFKCDKFLKVEEPKHDDPMTEVEKKELGEWLKAYGRNINKASP